MARILTDEERAQHERVNGHLGDARAQLWARVYAAMFEHAASGHVTELGTVVTTEQAREAARKTANAAAADFDEHYLGRVPSTKG